MEFKPSLLPIGIGSLPHKDPFKASSIIIKHFPQSPYWPQLPSRCIQEGMLLQFTEGMPGLVIEDGKMYFRKPFDPSSEWETFYEVYFSEKIEYFKIGDQYGAGLYAMLELLKGKEPSLVKGQVTGPITLGLGLSDENKIPAFYDPNLKEMIIKTIASKAVWQEKQFKKVVPDAKTLIFFDEPILSGYGSISMNLSKQEIIEAIRKTVSPITGLSGIHICGATDWSMIMEAGIDVIHFDAYRFFSNILAYTDELKDFISNGGFIGWGIVPSEEEFLRSETLSSLTKNFCEKIERLIKEGMSEEILLKNSFTSQSCGLSSLSEEMAEGALILTKELSSEIRKAFSLDTF